jgi:phosphonate transport system substrate-binding protein
LVAALSACGSDDTPAGPDTTADDTTVDAGLSGTLRVGAIPDQDPERLQRTYGLLAEHLADETGLDVEYVPVTDYASAVSGFAVGDLDLVWFGGLTGVQARLEVDGAQPIAQRDIDTAFTSVFIAGTDTGIEPFDTVDGLAAVARHSLTFGSESSTSGRLMPQYFLSEAGVDIDRDITGQVGFSGSHDATIEVVSAGTYDVGALNSQVWDSRVAEGVVDPTRVVEIFRTPEYSDYHWVARPDLNERYGEGAISAITDALLGLDIDDPDDAAILDLFGASRFVPTSSENYAAIERVARDIGAIR